MGVAVELVWLLGILAIIGAAVGVVRSLVVRATAPAPPAPAAPPPWEAHVGAVDNQTVVSVRRPAARPGDRDESLEIARFAADDPEWQSKLFQARMEATMRAIHLNGPGDAP